MVGCYLLIAFFIVTVALWVLPINGRSMVSRLRAEFKLGRSKKYIEGQVHDLKWNKHLGKPVDEERLTAMQDAADILWRLSWMT